MVNRRPIFTEDWPRYAVAAHIAFWATSGIFLACCLGAVARLVPTGAALLMFQLWIAAAGLLGAAALYSGKLYVGNQVFARRLLTGWSARTAGGFVFAGALVIIFFGYAITQIHGN